MNSITNFNYRTKFKKILNEEDIENVNRAFDMFCNFRKPSEAIEILWKLTFESAPYYLEIQDIGLPAYLITQENMAITRSELRVQYEKVHPGFLDVELPNEKCEKAFASLVKQTDTVIGKVVCDKCQSHLYIGNDDLQRILYLLKNDKDTYYFGGIRSLGFDIEPAEYLKPYHKEIYDLLESMNAFLYAEDGELPFYMSGEEECIETEDVSQEKDMPDAEHSEFKPLTPQEIIANSEVFKAFAINDDFNLLIPIAHLNFDLNEVVIKREEIKNLLIAFEAFNR